MPRLNRQKSEISRGILEGGQNYYDFDEEFKHDHTSTHVVSKPKKYIVINREDPDIQDNFKRIC